MAKKAVVIKPTYTDKQKYEYYKNIVNTGKKPDGTKLTRLEIHRYSVKAERIRRKLSRFMKGVDFATNNIMPR